MTFASKWKLKSIFPEHHDNNDRNQEQDIIVNTVMGSWKKENAADLDTLAQEVGARIENGIVHFEPFLDGPSVDPERWAKGWELVRLVREAAMGGAPPRVPRISTKTGPGPVLPHEHKQNKALKTS